MSVRTSNSRSADQRPINIAAGGDDVHVSVDDLLDHTWHYQCVVSPTFSAAAIAAALNDIPSSGSDRWTPAQAISAKMSSPLTASISDGYPILRKLNLKVMDAAHEIRRVHGQSLQGPDLLRLQRAVSTTSSDTSTSLHDQDGYVSLASLIIISPGASSESVTSPTSESPHAGLASDLFNFLRKQSKSRSTSATAFTSRTSSCRDAVRRSATSRGAVADPIRMNGILYARCLAVD